MSDQQPQPHTVHPQFVPAQWPDQSDHEDTGRNPYTYTEGLEQGPPAIAATANLLPTGPNHPTCPQNTPNLPQFQAPYILPPSPFVVPTPYLSFAPPTAPSVMPPTIPPFQYNRTMPSPGDQSAPRFDGHLLVTSCEQQQCRTRRDLWRGWRGGMPLID